MLRRRASAAGSAMVVAPVSTTKRTGPPLICPSVRKWPAVSAARVTLWRVEAASVARWCCPSESTRFAPRISIVALARSTETTVMPERVCPVRMVTGSPPSIATTAALSPMTPISATSVCAEAPKEPARRSRSAIKCGMNPVGIFRHARTEGPGYFATYLERRSIPWQLVALDEGAGVPRDPRRFSGLVFMGGPMSVNDELPWIIPVLELIREAVRKDVPVLGHCLGGQLMSKAFGGVVKANPVKEIGWGVVRVADNNVARTWLGERPAFE